MKQESASKTKLLETAIDMIWASSYGSVSVDDICAKAGVNKGSFYYFFKSKSDLAVAALNATGRASGPCMDRIFSPQTPAPRAPGAVLATPSSRTRKPATARSARCPAAPSAASAPNSARRTKISAPQVEHIFGRQLKYIESLVRDLAGGGPDRIQQPRASSPRSSPLYHRCAHAGQDREQPEARRAARARRPAYARP